MKHYKRIFSAVVLTVLSTAVDAVPFSVEARSLGMGNARVATADIATAPFANPGMLSYQRIVLRQLGHMEKRGFQMERHLRGIL